MDADKISERLERATLALDRAVENQALLPEDEALDLLKFACTTVSTLLKNTIGDIDSDPDGLVRSSSPDAPSGSVT